MSLINLQRQLVAERERILDELDAEYAEKAKTKKKEKLKQVTEELEAIYLNRLNVAKKLNRLHRNVSRRSRSRSKSPNQPKKNHTIKHRQRVNPLFKKLGIPVPPGQRIGDELVELGKKVKNR